MFSFVYVSKNQNMIIEKNRQIDVQNARLYNYFVERGNDDVSGAAANDDDSLEAVGWATTSANP